MLRLGSLFSGSGGFELAGILHGIEPVWSSEIEAFPLRVEAIRFPNCKQLGSVTEINGAEIEPVDIITFGSPCQDLSVAGKQKGIRDGERSNLFFEAIRIIKEMRNATANEFPRFAVWENVPGAFSSNKGEDFRAVLQAFCDIRGGGTTILYLSLRDGTGFLPDALWVTVSALPGASTTLNTGECPSVARESTLSQILEANAPEKYYLSPKACLGILRRALKSGKELPTMLEESLTECVRLGGEEFGPEEIAHAREILRTLWEKVGAQTFDEWVRRTVVLVQQEKVLLCGMRQQDNGGSTVSGTCEIAKDKQETCEKYDSICPVRYLWESWLHGGSSQGRESDEQLAGELGALVQKLSCQTAPFQTFVRCLRSASEGTPALRQALASVEEEYQAWLGHRIHSPHQESDGDGELTDDRVKCLNPWDCQSKRQYSIDGVYRTLDAGEIKWRMCYAIGHVVTTGGDCTAQGPCVYEDICPTEKAAGAHAVSYAIEGNTVDRDSKKNGCGYCEGRSPTLNTQDRHAVAYGIDQQGGKSNAGYGDGVSPTLCAISHGTPNAVCFQQNQRDEVRSMGEQTGALTAEPGVHNQNYLCYPEKARSLCARHDSSPCVDRGQNVVAIGMTNRGYESGNVTETIRAECHNAHPIVCYEGQNLCTDEKIAFALQAGRPDDHHIPAVCVQNTGRGWWNEGDTAETLRTPCGGDSTKANLVVERVQQDAVCFVPEQNHQRTFRQGEIAATLQTKYHAGSGGDAATVVYDCRGNGDGETCPTVTGDHNNRVTDFSAVAVKRIENE